MKHIMLKHRPTGI